MGIPNSSFIEFGVSSRDDQAVAHVDDAVAARADAGIVGDDDEGLALLRVELLHEAHDLVGGLRVERAGRLVGPDDRRVVDERAGDGDALALAAGELRRAVVRPVGRPTRSSACIARSRASRALTPETTSGSSTFSTAESTGSRL